jgi:UDP-glucose 4-epimerase
VNLGSATGYSVKEVIAAAEQTLQRTIPKEVKDRRPGDPAVLVASNRKAKEILGWTIRQSNLVDMVKTTADFLRSYQGLSAAERSEE